MRKNVLFLALAFSLAAVFVRLGLWQLDRLSERRSRNAAARALLALPPVELPRPEVAKVHPDSILGRRVKARGRYAFDRELVWVGRPYEATPGVYLLTPLLLEDSAVVLVHRGWMPAADGRHFDTAASREPAAASVVGLAVSLPAGRSAPALPGGVLPFMIQLAPDSSQGGRGEGGDGGPAWPLRLPGPALDDGPHLSYALQWFAFAGIAVIGAVLVVVRTKPRAASG